MKNAFRLYWQTVRTVLSQPSTWIILIGCIGLNLAFSVIVPYVLRDHNSIDVWMLPLMSGLCCFGLVTFFASAIGEIVANPNDRLFVLTRTVSRFTYLTVKLILSLCFACFIAGCCSLLFYGFKELSIFESSIPGGESIKFNVEAFGTLKDKITAVFCLCCFGAVYSTCFRYYTREMLISIIILVLFFAYCVAFLFVDSDSNTQEREKLMHLQYFTLPLAVVLPLSVIGAGVGYILNYKVNIGA